MKRLLIIIVPTIIVIGLAGCAKHVVDPDVVYQQNYSSYLKVLGEWTRNNKVYHNFDTELIVDATWYSKVFRDALRKEKARVEKLPEEEIAILERKDSEELKTMVRFLVSAYAPRGYRMNLADPEPSFRLWLSDVKGRRTAPVIVKSIKLKRKADRMYFPYVSEWASVYEVVFPRYSDEGQELVLSGAIVTLSAAGIQGEARLEWDVP
jgi:hypothetical protein